MKLAWIAGVLLLTGCFSAPKVPRYWALDLPADRVAGEADLAQPRPAFRVASVTVRPPYDRASLTVLRPDGTIAFDGANAFAASPASLLKGLTQDLLAASGRERWREAGRMVRPALTYDVMVKRWTYDCRTEKPAVWVELEIGGTRSGTARVPVKDGDYGRAFATAYCEAFTQADSQAE